MLCRTKSLTWVSDYSNLCSSIVFVLVLCYNPCSKWSSHVFLIHALICLNCDAYPIIQLTTLSSLYFSSGSGFSAQFRLEKSKTVSSSFPTEYFAFTPKCDKRLIQRLLLMGTVWLPQSLRSFEVSFQNSFP